MLLSVLVQVHIPVSYTHLDVYKRQRPLHGQDRGPVDVQPVDFRHARLADRPADAAHFDDLGELRAQLGADLF